MFRVAFTASISYSDLTDNSQKILKIMIRVSAYPQVSMILTNPGYQSTIVNYILDTFDRKGKQGQSRTQTVETGSHPL